MSQAWFSALTFASALGLAGIDTPAARAQLVALGPEVALDAPGATVDFCPRLAGRPDGELALMWNRNENAFEMPLWVIAVDASGVPGRRVLLDTVDDTPTTEDLAAGADGFTALWRRSLDPTPDIHRFPHVVSTLTEEAVPEGDALDLSRGGIFMSARPGGGLVTYWAQGRTLFVQTLDGGGVVLAPPVKIANADVAAPYLVGRSDGTFAIVWVAARYTGGRFFARGTWFQRFDPAGHTVGKPVRLVSASADFVPNRVQVTMGEDGSLAMITQEPFGPLWKVLLRTFKPNGSPLGRTQVVAVSGSGFGHDALPGAVAVDEGGHALVAWVQLGDPTGPQLFVQRFAPGGGPDGDALAVSSSADSAPGFCAAIVKAGGVWAVAWAGGNAGGVPNVYLRRYGDG